MEEAYELCDEIAIMDRGKIIAQGSPNNLLREHFSGVSISIPKSNFPEGKPQSVASGECFERTEVYEILTKTPDVTMRNLLDQKVSLEGVQIRNRNLEDLFLKLTGKGFE